MNKRDVFVLFFDDEAKAVADSWIALGRAFSDLVDEEMGTDNAEARLGSVTVEKVTFYEAGVPDAGV